MSIYWPFNEDLQDTESPMSILGHAREDWLENSNGVLHLVLQEITPDKGNSEVVVHAKHIPSNRTAELFSVYYRSNSPYPVRIIPREEDLPDYLKKTYYKPGAADLKFAIQGFHGEEVTNKWVCNTPAEFRKSLLEVFNLGVIKSEVFNLYSTSTTEVNK
jgi:hypothetical protein